MRGVRAVMRLVDRAAPRSTADLLLKALAVLLLINLANGVAVAAIGRGAADPVADLARTTAVALPFVLVTLSILRRQRLLQAQLSVLATTDTLTGLPNRRDFLARARLAAEEIEGGALLLLDADRFKRINDRWGHAVGDACLAAIAARMRATLRPADLLGRIGGRSSRSSSPGRAGPRPRPWRRASAPPSPSAPPTTPRGSR